MSDDDQSPSEIEAGVWRSVLFALAGVAPPAEYVGPDGHQVREAMKSHATTMRLLAKEPKHASFRAPAWVLHAFSHWCRAYGPLQRWDATKFDEEFPDGMTFRQYLAAWLWSVGIHALQMTPADLEAVHALTGVGPLPHPLLPNGYSEFRDELLRTTEVDKVPAATLTLDALVAAIRRSEA